MSVRETIADIESLQPVAVKIYVGGQLEHQTVFRDSLEFGRQQAETDPPEDPPYKDTGTRVVIAKHDQATISRQHLRLKRLSGQALLIRNLSKVNTITVGNKPLPPGDNQAETLPFEVKLGQNIMLRVEQQIAPDKHRLISSSAPMAAPTAEDADANRDSQDPSVVEFLKANRSHSEVVYLLEGLHATLRVFQQASNSADFLTSAARAVIDVVGLDTAAALQWNGEDFVVKYQAGTQVPDWAPSREILKHVREKKRTFRDIPREADPTQSLDQILALVAAPILNAEGEVIGALYGDRRLDFSEPGTLEISEVEALLVELVASSVSSSLARLEHERAALEARVQFEQFFTPELASQLESQPDLLAGKDVEISVLFCDIRRFSRITEELGPTQTTDWINNVLGVLSDSVIEHHGVLVDYVGDELFAMWGAPVERPDHATLACQAAIDMMRKIPLLNERWEKILGEPMAIGIGVSTGMARVGNVGSARKFKYGAVGNTVNLGSRVQSATKQMKSALLVSGETARQLDPRFSTRRLCRIQVVNIRNPFDLHELVSSESPDWQDFKQNYETALEAFEQADFHAAVRLLGNLLADHPDDGPTLRLMKRLTEAMIDPSKFSKIWVLDEK